jgi:hypothetical protein
MKSEGKTWRRRGPKSEEKRCLWVDVHIFVRLNGGEDGLTAAGMPVTTASNDDNERG